MDRDVQAVRRPVVLMADALAGRAVEVDRSVIPAKDHCPARFRPLRDDYLASCRGRGNSQGTVVAKDKAVSRFLAYLDDVGVDDLAALGVRDLSGFLVHLRQRGLRRKTIAALRSCLADFLAFLATVGPDTAGSGGSAAAAQARPSRIRTAPVDRRGDPPGAGRDRPSVRYRQTRLRDDPGDRPTRPADQ